jgi:hypothetical protein
VTRRSVAGEGEEEILGLWVRVGSRWQPNLELVVRGLTGAGEGGRLEGWPAGGRWTSGGGSLGRVGRRGGARATPAAGGGRRRLGRRRRAGRREGGQTYHGVAVKEEQRLEGGRKEEEKDKKEEEGGGGQVSLCPRSTACVRRFLTRRNGRCPGAPLPGTPISTNNISTTNTA